MTLYRIYNRNGEWTPLLISLRSFIFLLLPSFTFSSFISMPWRHTWDLILLWPSSYQLFTAQHSIQYSNRISFSFSHFSGLDVVSILNYLGLESMSSKVASNVATGASTFVIAYAVHKVFAPIRISMTLFSVPFIVRFLRNRGILKTKSTTKWNMKYLYTI